MCDMFPKNLAQIAAARRLKPPQLAEQVGVSSALVRLWLKGENVPSFHVLIKLAHALECSIDALVTESHDGLPYATHEEMFMIKMYRQENKRSGLTIEEATRRIIHGPSDPQPATTYRNPPGHPEDTRDDPKPKKSRSAS